MHNWEVTLLLFTPGFPDFYGTNRQREELNLFEKLNQLKLIE